MRVVKQVAADRLLRLPIAGLFASALFLLVQWLQPPEALTFVSGGLAPDRLNSIAQHDLSGGGPSVHAASAVAMPGGRLFAVWFEGSAEAQPDVALYASRFDGKDWSTPKLLLDRARLETLTGRLHSVIGNPALYLDANGRVHLFVTSPQFGGWASSSIEHLVSDDGGASFRAMGWPRLSPILNTSVLSRFSAAGTEGGGFVLPAYMEFKHVRPYLLRYHSAQRFMRPVPVPDGGGLLQPGITTNGTGGAIATFRALPEREQLAWWSELKAGAAEWTTPITADIANFGTGIAILPAAPDGFWLAVNSRKDSRASLDLVRVGPDFATRERMAVTGPEDGPDNTYALLILDDLGQMHLFHTRNRQSIAHHIYRASP